MKNLVVTLSSLFLITACSTAHPTQRQLAAVEREGGADGGGGDLIVHPLADESDLEEAIAEIPSMLAKVLAYHEILALTKEGEHWAFERNRSSAVLGQAYKKLFPRTGEGVFEELKRVRFVAKKEGPCADTRFSHKDASAFNRDPQEICLSVERLSAKFRVHTLASDLLALAAHELSHRLGTTEEEAIAFQRAVLLKLRRSSFREMKRNMTLGDSLIRDRRADLVKIALQKSSEPKAWPELCSRVSSYHSGIRATMSMVSGKLEDGFSLARLKGLRALVAADLQSLHMPGFCRTYFPNRQAVLYGREFKPGESYDLKEEGEMGIVLTEPGYLMMYGFPADENELAFNFQQAERSLGIFEAHFLK